VRTLLGVVLAILVLAPLATWALRGARRLAGVPPGGPRSGLQVVAEGLIVLAAIVLGVLVVVAFAASG
jgi:hypothetical protein